MNTQLKLPLFEPATWEVVPAVNVLSLLDILEARPHGRYFLNQSQWYRLFKQEGSRTFYRCACPGPVVSRLNDLAPALSFQIRKLTPLECERAMNMPDGWTEGLDDHARWDILGNGVNRAAAEWIGRRIIEAEP